jgi:hypothetical protein
MGDYGGIGPVDEEPSGPPDRMSSDWLIIDKAPFYLLCADVIDVLNEYLDWHSQLHFRRTCRKVAVQTATMWAAVTVGLAEARRRGLKCKATDIAIGLSAITVGVVGVGGTVAGVGAVLVLGKGSRGSADLCAFLITTVGARALALAATGLKTVRGAHSTKALSHAEMARVIAAEQQWRLEDIYDTPTMLDARDAAEGASDVYFMVERQRFSIAHQSWGREHLLPIDPPAWECPQLGVPSRANPVEHIAAPEDVTPHRSPQWDWDGQWVPQVEAAVDTASDARARALAAARTSYDGSNGSAIESAQSAGRTPSGLLWWLRSCVAAPPAAAEDESENEPLQPPPLPDPEGWKYGFTFARGGASRPHNTSLDVVRQRTLRRVMHYRQNLHVAS